MHFHGFHHGFHHGFGGFGDYYGGYDRWYDYDDYDFAWRRWDFDDCGCDDW